MRPREMRSMPLLFCGSNAYRAGKIDTVKHVMDDLMGKDRNDVLFRSFHRNKIGQIRRGVVLDKTITSLSA